LHNDAENDALFNTNLGGLEDGIPDAANVLPAVASLEHLRLVEVEERLKVFPSLLTRKVGGGAGIIFETHLDIWKRVLSIREG
jgi:hypothetical protein